MNRPGFGVGVGGGGGGGGGASYKMALEELVFEKRGREVP